MKIPGCFRSALLFFHCVLLSVLFLCPGLAAADELYLEGLLYDAGKPSESAAVVNGQPVRAGDEIGGWLILEIRDSGMRARQLAEGREAEFQVTSAQKAAADEKSLEEEIEAYRLTETGAAPGWKESILRIWKFWNPLQLPARLSEVRAVMDMTRVYNSAVAYFNENSRLPQSLAEMSAEGYIGPSFLKRSEESYTIRIETGKGQLEVRANAASSENPLMRCFFLGEDAVLRSSTVCPANDDSPAHAWI